MAGSVDAIPIRYEGPELGSPDRTALDAWCGSVGHNLVRTHAQGSARRVDRLWVMTWNAKTGEGDVVRGVDVARERIAAAGGNPNHLVVLLQEAYTRENDPPGEELLERGGEPTWPSRRIGDEAKRPESSDVEHVADELGMSLIYTPSMLNGKPGAGPPEDRGNAVLSAIPIDSITILELPFEQQRRSVPVAYFSGTNYRGDPWTLRVASVHLDLHARGSRALGLWRTSGRRRQAEGLVAGLRGPTPVVVAGDFNTSLSASEAAVLVMKEAFPRPSRHPTKPTSVVGPGGILKFRLDHMFFRVPDEWRVGYERMDEMLGSDHFPLLGWIQF